MFQNVHSKFFSISRQNQHWIIYGHEQNTHVKVDYCMSHYIPIPQVERAFMHTVTQKVFHQKAASHAKVHSLIFQIKTFENFTPREKKCKKTPKGNLATPV